MFNELSRVIHEYRDIKNQNENTIVNIFSLTQTKETNTMPPFDLDKYQDEHQSILESDVFGITQD